jgi:hypothetical protein
MQKSLMILMRKERDFLPVLHLRKSEMLHFQLVARKVLSCTNNYHASEGKRDKVFFDFWSVGVHVNRQTVGRLCARKRKDTAAEAGWLGVEI